MSINLYICVSLFLNTYHFQNYKVKKEKKSMKKKTLEIRSNHLVHHESDYKNYKRRSFLLDKSLEHRSPCK